MVMNEDIQGVLKVFQEGFKPKLFHKNIHKLYLLVSITIIMIMIMMIKVTPSVSGPVGTCCILIRLQGDQLNVFFWQKGPSEWAICLCTFSPRAPDFLYYYFQRFVPLSCFEMSNLLFAMFCMFQKSSDLTTAPLTFIWMRE